MILLPSSNLLIILTYSRPFIQQDLERCIELAKILSKAPNGEISTLSVNFGLRTSEVTRMRISQIQPGPHCSKCFASTINALTFDFVHKPPTYNISRPRTLIYRHSNHFIPCCGMHIAANGGSELFTTSGAQAVTAALMARAAESSAADGKTMSSTDKVIHLYNAFCSFKLTTDQRSSESH